MDEVKQQSDAHHHLADKRRGQLPLLTLAGLIVLLAAVYTGLCVYVSLSSTILPHVQVGGTAVGGMTVAHAAQQIKLDTNARFQSCKTELHYDLHVLEISGEHVTADGQAAALDAYRVGRDTSPLLRGAFLLKALFVPTELETPVIWDPETSDLDALLDAAFQGLERETVQSRWTMGDTAIQMTKGVTGYRYDREDISQRALQSLTEAAQGGEAPRLTLEPVQGDPDPIDWDALAALVTVEPVDAALDPETAEIVPSVTGVSLDVQAAKRLYDAADEGEELSIPLTFTEPDMTTEALRATLFRDILGETTTWISGVANRLSNVTLAAKLCNGIILMPGDEFSYWDIIAPCTTAQGFLPAPSYVQGATVDSIGGGVCQVSSSIYYTALKANLEIVERQNHTYAVEYVPDGADATVYSGSPDFRFKNDLEYPIKLVAVTKGRELCVQILGTKTDDTYVKMQFVELSRTQPETIYKADASIPMGTTKVSVTSYIGRKVEAYRCVYNGDGTLLSRTLESVNNYKKRDKVILCNPTDLYLYDPTIPAPTPSAPPSTQPSAAPEPSLSPEPSESSAPSEAPDAAPGPSEAPDAAEAPMPDGSADPSATPDESLTPEAVAGSDE